MYFDEIKSFPNVFFYCYFFVMTSQPSLTPTNVTVNYRSQVFTALDPAQPGFEGADKEVRLDKGDADYVEVVHTNAAPFLPTLGFGLMMPHGTTQHLSLTMIECEM